MSVMLATANLSFHEPTGEQMARCLSIVLTLLFLGCDNSPDPQQVLESSRRTTAEVETQLELIRKATMEAQKEFNESTQPSKTDIRAIYHPAEVVAKQLVTEFSLDELPAQGPTIVRLNKLDSDERDEELQRLQRYIQSQQYKLWFTEIVVLEGEEDVATCFFQTGNEVSLIIMLAFHNKSWVITAYETSQARFARPEGQTLDQYANEMVTAVKAQGTVLLEGPLTEGLYYIEH